MSPLSAHSHPSVFITGTDTGVGKTLISAGLAWHAKQRLLSTAENSVCVYKPVQTGCPVDQPFEDGETIKTLLGNSESEKSVIATCCSYQHPLAAAPYACQLADSTGRPDFPVSLAQIQTDFKRLQQAHPVVIVEGAGGIRVPLNSQHDMRDLMAALGIPVILVVRPNLGTINHTLLSVEALLSRNIPVLGAIINRIPDSQSLKSLPDRAAIETLSEVFQAWLPVPVIGCIPDRAILPGCLSDSANGDSHLKQAFSQLGATVFRPIKAVGRPLSHH